MGTECQHSGAFPAGANAKKVYPNNRSPINHIETVRNATTKTTTLPTAASTRDKIPTVPPYADGGGTGTTESGRLQSPEALLACPCGFSLDAYV